MALHPDIWVLLEQLVAVLGIKAVLLFFLSTFDGSLLTISRWLLVSATTVLFGDLRHNLIKAVRSYSLDALLLVDLVDWHALVLQREKEEHELVYLLLHEPLLLLLLAKPQSQVFLVLHEANLALGQDLGGLAAHNLLFLLLRLAAE